MCVCVCVSGTTQYIPPEWYLHGSYKAVPSTIWQLGVLLYDMVSGVFPFSTRREVISDEPYIKTNMSRRKTRIHADRTHKQTHWQKCDTQRKTNDLCLSLPDHNLLLFSHIICYLSFSLQNIRTCWGGVWQSAPKDGPLWREFCSTHGCSNPAPLLYLWEQWLGVQLTNSHSPDHLGQNMHF